jgi:hypothetical protein
MNSWFVWKNIIYCKVFYLFINLNFGFISQIWPFLAKIGFLGFRQGFGIFIKKIK